METSAGSPHTKLDAVSRSRLTDVIVEQITDRILTGEIAPGTPLRQEQLAAALGVSRTPLREALRTLQAYGFLTASASSGTLQVVSPTREESRDIYEARAMIDGYSARLAAVRASDAQIEELHELTNGILDSLEPFDLRHYLVAHSEFHVGLVRISGNRTLLGMEPIVRMSTRMLYPQLGRSTERVVESAKEHSKIFEAVRDRDPERAERLARDHVESVVSFWLREDEDRA